MYQGYPPPPPDYEPHKDAGKAFLSGFAGCLGVGLAVVAVFVFLIILLAVLGHH
jgi:hypothetical protein